MDAFLPSEIGRLIYGYLSSQCGPNLAEEFSKLCPSMRECRQIKQRYSRNFHTTIQDLTLEAILDQYSKLCSLIFKHADEKERVHKNVLNLLERILSELPKEPSIDSLCSNVFKDVQNLPLDRNGSDTPVVNEGQGLENKVSDAAKALDNSSVKFKSIRKFSRAKKKLSTSTNQSEVQTAHDSNQSTSIEPENTSFPARIPTFRSTENTSRNNADTSICTAQMDTFNLNPHSTTESLVQENLTAILPTAATSSSHLPSQEYQKSIFDLSNDAEISPETILRVSNCPSDDDHDHLSEIKISYSPIVKEVAKIVVIDSDENPMSVDLFPETAVASVEKSGMVPENSKTNQISSNKYKPSLQPNSTSDTNKIDTSSSSASSFSSSCSNSSSSSSTHTSSFYSSSSSTRVEKKFPEETHITKEKEKNSNQSADDNKEDGEISSSESLENVSLAGFLENISSAESSEDVPLSESVDAILDKRKQTSTDSKITQDKFQTPPLCLSQSMQRSVKKPVDNPESTESSNRKNNKVILSEECLSIFENLSKNFKYRSPYLSPGKSRGSLHPATLSPFSKMYVTPVKPNVPHVVTFKVPEALPVACSSSSNSYDQRNKFSFSSTDGVKSVKSPQSCEISTMRPISKVDIEKRRSKRLSTSKIERIGEKQKKSFVHRTQASIISKKKQEKKGSESSKVVRRLTENWKRENVSPKGVKDLPVDTSSLVSRSKSNDLLHVYVRDTNEIAVLHVSSEFTLYHRDSTCIIDYSPS